MIQRLFASAEGERIYDNAIRAINDFSMQMSIERGVLVAFSGGADSVTLLLMLLKYRSEHGGYFPIKALHVNHMIRGEEAERDAQFSSAFCKNLGIEFDCVKIDVPAISKETKISLEEAARNARYDEFRKVIESDPRFFSIAVAHNATDNLETIIFNMMRGSGISGMCGISPTRDNIVRPLIYSSKSEIQHALTSVNIPFVVDSTNSSIEYSRNYIRHEILPRLAHISPSPELMGTRLSSNLRRDKEFIELSADDFIANNLIDSKIPADKLLGIHKSLFFHVFKKMCKEKGDSAPERKHGEAVYSLLHEKNFSYSLPGGLRFECCDGLCYVTNQAPCETIAFDQILTAGINKINGYSTVIILSDAQNIKSYSNIYNFTIQAKLPFDIINDSLRITSKSDGDHYSYGGITRKLKKLFNDRKIPTSRRNDVPVFRDSKGILWVVGFGVRDVDISTEDHVIVALAEPFESQRTEGSLYVPKRK